MAKSRFRYKSCFLLPRAEADFVCALAQLTKGEPDQVLAALVRMWANGEGSCLRMDVWQRARADGRGGWARPPPGGPSALGPRPGYQAPALRAGAFTVCVHF